MAKKFPNPYKGNGHDFVFVRVFPKVEYARQFMAGSLRMGSLNVYRRIEDGGRRGDADEGASYRATRGNFTMTFGPVTLPSGETLGPIVVDDALMVRIHDEQFGRNVHVLCVNRLRWGEGAKWGVYRIPNHMQGFGEYAVVFPLKTVIDGVQAHCEAHALQWEARDVRYVPDNYSGDWGPFTKTSRYSEQREFRVAIQRPDSVAPEDHIFVDIGPLSGASLIRTTTILRLQMPCLRCSRGRSQGVIAPSRRRRRRIRKKIDSRLGASRYFQVCDSCWRRHRVFRHGSVVKVQTRAKHRRITSWRRDQTGR